MNSRTKPRSPRLEITRNPYGYSISIKTKRPEERYLPPDPAEVKRAIGEMKEERRKKKVAAPLEHRA